MKITALRTLVCDGGWRPWIFVAVDTDAGVTGYSEASESFGSHDGVVSTIRSFEKLLIGKDARAFESIFSMLYRATRQSTGGVVQKAIAGIENAILDAKAKALGVPVYELFGGPTRDDVPLYWSHFGTTRVRSPEFVGKPPVRTLADVAALGREIRASGYGALKTNLLLAGSPPRVLQQGFRAEQGSPDQLLARDVLEGIDATIGALREGTGSEIGIALDLNFNFKPAEAAKLAERLAPHDLLWLEYDAFDPRSVAELRSRATMPICSGENLLGAREYRPFFEARAMDVVSLDVIWNGLAQSKKIADMAETYDLNFAPHNHYSHLASLISAHLCACTTNVQILETDVDDVPWKDEIVTRPPRTSQGTLRIPTGPGWGADLNENAVRQHPWPRK